MSSKRIEHAVLNRGGSRKPEGKEADKVAADWISSAQAAEIEMMKQRVALGGTTPRVAAQAGTIGDETIGVAADWVPTAQNKEIERMRQRATSKSGAVFHAASTPRCKL